MSCASPIPFETLVALWAGELAVDVAEAVEDHLFACDECAARAERLDRPIAALREQVPPVLSRPQRDQLAARGLKILEMAFEPGARGEAVFALELDLLVFALHGELAGASRVDLEIADATGQVRFEHQHVPFDAERGEVLVACQQHYRAYSAMYEGDPEFRLIAHEAGRRRQVGAYVIKHVWPPLPL